MERQWEVPPLNRRRMPSQGLGSTLGHAPMSNVALRHHQAANPLSSRDRSVEGLVIARWSWGLIRDAGGVLLDRVPGDEDLPGEIREAIERSGERITDLHIWQVGPGHHAAIIALASVDPNQPSHYKARLAKIHGLSHVTIEVEQAQHHL